MNHPEFSGGLSETSGWPKGIAIHRDGSLWVADHRRGPLETDPTSRPVDVLPGHRHSDSRKGLNDPTFNTQGNHHFTDQDSEQGVFVATTLPDAVAL